MLRTTSAWHSDWYCHDILQDLILKLTTLQSSEVAKQPSQWKPEIAVVLANDSVFHTKAGHESLADLVVHPLRDVLPAMGALMDVIMLDDLKRENLPSYKLFVFLDIPCVTPDQRKMVHDCLSARKAQPIFMVCQD